MSGYIEVKLASVSARGFSTWKTWRKQWCILRPHTANRSILLVFHSSAGMSSTSQVEIPKGSILCRINSKTKEYAFGIYSSVNSQRSLLLLAGHSENDSQLWMSRIRTMLDGKERLENNQHHNNCFHVSLIDNEFSNTCGYRGLYGRVKLDTNFFEICDTVSGQTRASLKYSEIDSVELTHTPNKKNDNQKIFLVKTKSDFKHGFGKISFFSLSASILTNKLRNRLLNLSPEIVLRKLDRRISRSEGTLFTMANLRKSHDSERDSGLSACEPISSKSNTKWYCSLEDPFMRLSINDDEITIKGKSGASLVSAGLLLSTPCCPVRHEQKKEKLVKSNEMLTSSTWTSDFSELSFDRRSSDISVVSGVYEEIQETNTLSRANQKLHKYKKSHDNTYEVLAECVYGTARRHSKKLTPPPLPPRRRIHPKRFDSASDSGMEEESIYSTLDSSLNYTKSRSACGSLSSLPHYMIAETMSMNESSKYSQRLDLHDFRSRVQSDPLNLKRKVRNDRSNHPESSCSGVQKKRFELNVTPSKSINKMVRAFKKLSGSSGINHAKDSAKSCETLDSKDPNDELERKRCSKSEENLDVSRNSNEEWFVNMSNENVKDLSVIYAENNFKKAYPEEILQLVLKGETNVAKHFLRRERIEDEYVLMSPRGSNNTSPSGQIGPIKSPQTIELENNYVVMKGV